MHSNGNPGASTAPPVTGSTLVPRTSPRFLTITAVAKALGMSEATMYRAVRAGEFPAVRIRNRYVVPVRVLDALEDAALASGGTVDAADWVEPGHLAAGEAGDRGSVPVRPLIAFGLFLLAGAYAPRLSFATLAVFGFVAVVAVVAFVVASCRAERRFNEAARARFYASPQGRAILGLDVEDAGAEPVEQAGAGR